MLLHRHVRFNRGLKIHQRRLLPGAEPPQPNFPQSSRRPCLACCGDSSLWRHVRLMAGPGINALSSVYTLASLSCARTSLSTSSKLLQKFELQLDP